MIPTPRGTCRPASDRGRSACRAGSRVAEKGRPYRHDQAGHAAIAPRHHVGSAARQRAVGDQDMELVWIGVVSREPRDIGSQQVAGPRNDGAEQPLQIKPAGEVLCRFDHREQAMLAFLLQLEPVANGHGHAHRLDQRRFARIAWWQRIDIGQPAGELVRRRTLVKQIDQVANGLLAAVDMYDASHTFPSSPSCERAQASRNRRKAGEGPPGRPRSAGRDTESCRRVRKLFVGVRPPEAGEGCPAFAPRNAGPGRAFRPAAAAMPRQRPLCPSSIHFVRSRVFGSWSRRVLVASARRLRARSI